MKNKTNPSFFAVHLKLGEVADPYAPVWIQLVGEKGESGQIQIKPGYGPKDKFENGRMYKVVARVNDIGRVGTLGGGGKGRRGAFPRLNISSLKSAFGCGSQILIIFVTQCCKRIAF